MASLSDRIRRQVIERARGHCEYCQAPIAVIVEMEIDHIIPEAAGGPSTLENLALACRGCNSFKTAFQEAVDPATGEMAPLFNPRQDRWAEHFEWTAEGTMISGQTPTGRATVMRLRMNRERMVEARRLWVSAGWHPPDDQA